MRSSSIQEQYRELVAYKPSYPARIDAGRIWTVDEAAWECLAAGWRILDEVGDDGISVGAEEDAERAIRAVATQLGSPAVLVTFARLLVDVLAEVRSDDGLGSLARELAARVDNARLHYRHPSWGNVEGRLLRVGPSHGQVLVHDVAPTGAREYWPVAKCRVELRGAR